MKKTLISLAAASLVASTAFAADKGIDIDVGGQAVIYYETHDDNRDGGGTALFSKEDSVANVGVQLDLGSDLGNNFTFGSQITYLGTTGLEKNLVNGTKQIGANLAAGSGTSQSTTDELMLTKIFIAKQIGNTTLKLGRQELPQSLSPLAFTEGWNVFKNTFDAIVAINTDIPNTTLVGAFVSGGTSMDLATTGDLAAGVAGEAYMVTAQTTVIPMTTLTASYYTLKHVGGNHTADATAENDDWLGGKDGVSADAFWLQAEIGKDLPLGLNLGLQYAQINPNDLDDTKAWGAKLSISPMDKVSASLAYTDVNSGAVAMRNTGTNIKTALYTQMVYNQNAITRDADTYVAKVSYNMGDMGSLTAAYGYTDAGSVNNMFGANYKEMDLIYKVKAGGVQYFAAYVNRKLAKDANGMNGSVATASNDSRIRVWGRYNF